MRSLGNIFRGESASPETAIVPTSGHPAASSNLAEYPPVPSAEHTLRRIGPPIYEGVPTADLPIFQQINCMTCSQALRPYQRQVRCHVCSSYVHQGCVEVLKIGHKFNAEMCLVCQQGITRQLRAITAIELQNGRRWDPSKWFVIFQDCVNANTGYGISNNRDLNELEMKLASAIRQGLNFYKVSESRGEATDISEPRVLRYGA